MVRRDAVVLEDIEVAARLALPHRRRRNPFDSPGLDDDLLDDALGDDLDPDDDPEPDPDPEPGGDARRLRRTTRDVIRIAASRGANRMTLRATREPAATPAPSTTTGAAAPYRTRLFAVRGTGAGTAGRRSRAITETGRRVGAERPSGPAGRCTWWRRSGRRCRTSTARGRVTGRCCCGSEDLRVAVREGRESNLVLFCVDASGSMAARKRMEQVKTAVLSLLLDAYQRRDKVGLVTFRGDRADLALPPTGSIDVAAARLEDLPGGRPDAACRGTARGGQGARARADPRPAAPTAARRRDRRPGHRRHRCRRTVALGRGALAGTGVAAVVVDCESGPMRMGLARILADHLGAEHVPVAEVSAGRW